MLWTYLKWRISVFRVDPLEAADQPWQYWSQRRSWTKLSTITSLIYTPRVSIITKLWTITRLSSINRFSTVTRLATTTGLLQLSQLLPSTSEPPNEVFNMVLNKPVAANSCYNQKNWSPNQPVYFKYPKREYKDSNQSFQPQWYKRWKWLHYNEQKDIVTC